MSKIADSVIRIPCTDQKNFIKFFLTFLTPLHKLTPSVVNLAAEIIYQRFELSKVINNNDVLDDYLLTNEKIRNEVITNCQLSVSNYHVGMTKLKKAGFFINGKVNPKFLPKITPESTSYSLMLLFTIPTQEKDETREDI